MFWWLLSLLSACGQVGAALITRRKIMRRKEEKDGRGRNMTKMVGDGRRHMRRRQQRRSEIVLERLHIPSVWWRRSYNLLPGPVGPGECWEHVPRHQLPVQLWVQEVVFD